MFSKMPSSKKSKSVSRKLTSYQRKIRSQKKAIAELAKKKGIRFLAAAAMVIKGRKSVRKSGRKSARKSSSKKSARRSHSCPRGKVWRKAHKSSSGKRVAGACVKKGGRKSKSRSRSSSRK
jgi:hypothetical protein